jgi:hypothetical protein
MPIRLRLAALLLAAAGALVAGCSTVPNPLATAAPPDALHPNSAVPAPVEQGGLQPTPAPSAIDAKLAEVQRRRATWDRAGILSYRLRLIFGCQCALGGKTVDVTVRRGEIVDATVDGQPLDLAGLVGVPATVDQLFDYAERNAGAGKEELKYDETFGYPLALGVDPDLNARDDEIRIAVLELAPGR